MSKPNQICDECGVAIPAESPGGLCPTCTFRGLVSGESDDGVVPGVELGELIGEGAFGEVYEGLQLDYSLRRVAVKLARDGGLSPHARERFVAEMQILALMDHPNISRFLTSGITTDGRPYYAMEYIEGEVLGSARYTKDIVLKTMIALCDAVAHAHQRGVVHRDLKASNVLIDRESGAPKIIDFGIARVLEGPLEEALGVTYADRIGTPLYMSPEQLEGRPDVDTRVDIYALGLLLYEMVLGHPVLDGVVERERSWSENARRVRAHNLPKLTRHGLATEWDWVARKACAVDREERYQTAIELKQDLEALRDGRAVSVGRQSLSYLMAKTLRRYWVAAVFVALALAGLVGVTVLTSLLARSESEAKTKVEASLESVRAAEEATKRSASDALLNQGVLEFSTNKHVDARASLRKALEVWPGNSDAEYALNFLESTHRFAELEKRWTPGFSVQEVEVIRSGFVLHGAGQKERYKLPRRGCGWAADDVQVTDSAGVIAFRSYELGERLLSPLRYGAGAAQAHVSLEHGAVCVVTPGNVVEIWDVSFLGPSFRKYEAERGIFYIGFEQGSERLWMADADGILYQWNDGAFDCLQLKIVEIPRHDSFGKAEGLKVLREYWWRSGQGNFETYAKDNRIVRGVLHLMQKTRVKGDVIEHSVRGREDLRAAIGTLNGRVFIADDDGWFQPVEGEAGDLRWLLVDATANIVCLVGRGDELRFYDGNSCEKVGHLQLQERVLHAALLDGGERVAVVTADGVLSCYELRTGRKVGTAADVRQGLKAVDDVRLVAVPGNDEVLVTVAGSYQIQRFDLMSGASLTNGMRHDREVAWCGCLPGGEIAVSVDMSTDAIGPAKLRVWSMRTGRELVPPFAFDAPILWPAVMDGGTKIAVATADGTVYRWVVNTK